MIIRLTHNHQSYEANLSEPLDISIPLKEGSDSVNCFYAPFMETSPVVAGDFIGSTKRGGPVNFLNVRFNPHGNGTHTECVGHIAQESYSINQHLKHYHFVARLITIYPAKMDNGDRVIQKEQLVENVQAGETAALIIRTMPNDERKLTLNYSGTNPPYLDAEATRYLVDCGVKHLLLDLPSVDREEDGGAILSHKAFWQYPDKIRENCTISELIYVKSEIKDGLYLLNLQIASFEIDVSPSKPVLYRLTPTRNDE